MPENNTKVESPPSCPSFSGDAVDTTPDLDAPIPCPYVLGAKLKLHATPPNEPSFFLELTIIELFLPFTYSVALKVKSDSADLPNEMILKLYDRRFAASLRDQENASTLTFGLEARYAAWVSSGSAPSDLEAAEDLCDDYYDDNDPRLPELNEHVVALNMAEYFPTECAIYDRLGSLQGRHIPRLFASTRFCADQVTQHIDLSVPGILLEVIPGIALFDIDPSVVDGQALLSRCLNVVDLYGDMGVLNRDMRLGNIIIKPDGNPVIIDFAHCRLREEGESDEEWKSDKWDEDEEGAIGYVAKRKFGWEYTPTYKYIVFVKEFL